MSHGRLTSASTLQLFAELAAYPFASECAFRARLTSLSPGMAGETRDFWRQVEAEMLRANPSFSVDEIVNLRDFVWFNAGAGDRELTDLLRSLPERCLCVEGAVVRPQLPAELRTPKSSGAEAREFWRSMELSLPPDLLLAAIPDPPPCRSVAFVSPRLDRQLIDQGFAQIHLHYGAASDFTDLWVGALLALARPGERSALFSSPGAAFDEGRELGDWLVRAALVRFLLAAYLSDREHEDDRFEEWVRRQVQPLLSATSAAVLQTVLREVSQGRREPEAGVRFAEVGALYRRLSGATLRGKPKRAADIQGLDPIARFFSASSSPLVPTPEMQFVIAGLRHLDPDNPRQKDQFSPLFWQVVRLRSIFYRHLIQRPSTPGLLWFFRFYDRIRKARIWGTAVQIESTALLEGVDRGLRHLELRTAPSASLSEMHEQLKDAENAAKALEDKDPERRLEIGIVLHFTRDRGGGAKQGVPQNRWSESHADPGYRRTGWRYSVYYQEKRREARALALLLQRYPATLYRIRGLDICTDEVGVPTWVLVPLFRYVHEAGKDASAYLQHVCPVLYAPALRSTVHAGEDFAHLLTGLRRITEAMQYLPLKEGDRLGHAIALGLDPADWARRMGTVVMPKEERLFDLVWEWGWYSHQRVNPPDAHRASFLDREVARLSREIFQSSQSPDRLEQMVGMLHDPNVLLRVGFPTGVPFRGQPPPQRSEEQRCLHLLVQYLTDRSVFQRGRELAWIPAEPEAELLATIQAELMVHVGAQGVVVEANPSSNLLVGDLRDLAKHPLWRLSPPRDCGSTPPLSVCIGSDDPITFATTLREEYQRLIDALVLGGHSQEEAERWLERVRKQGRISRFTLPRREEGLSLDRPPRRRFPNLPPIP